VTSPRRTPAHVREDLLRSEGVEPRPLITLHLPLNMGVVIEVMDAIAKGYPSATVGEDGTILGLEKRD